MHRVHSEQQGRDERQPGLGPEHDAFTGVHEHAGDGAVQTHVDQVEVERRHSTEEDVQPGGAQTQDAPRLVILHRKRFRFQCIDRKSYFDKALLGE